MLSHILLTTDCLVVFERRIKQIRAVLEFKLDG